MEINSRQQFMTQTLLPIALVLLSGMFHSVWNLFTKLSLNKSVFLWWTQWVAILVYLPTVIYELQSHSIEPTGYLLLLGTMALHGLYVILLAKTYTIGDMSQVYPIMRGTSPLLVPLLGVLLLGESLTFYGWLGVALIVAGVLSLGGWRIQAASKKPVYYALAVGIIITSYTVYDKITLAYVPPLTLNEATNVGNLIALSYIALRSGMIKQEWQANWKTILLGGVLAPGAYILFLFALWMAPVSQLAPMREIGTVFGTFLAIFLLREEQGPKRIAASILITAGVILLGIWG
ncbi:hypothetical protein CBW65_03190 [Tumebacillus avium]|uniref:EamA domain-containing protein n=1 Tax=Tumebacillus avium TaxID=1903704 RepID=A0A1Y0IIN8_9BACL|nr:EamA family transporter [Tumebacillus avium]ARU60170.1 hypothetical protein CBW65_03190 [Tumebacillus avium]